MEPTMGRIVHYTPGDPNDVNAPEAPAIVSRVNKDGTLDLTVFPPETGPYSVTNVAQSESGGSESDKWAWPPAAPTGSAPETGGDKEEPDPAPPVGGGNEGSPEGGGSGTEQPTGGAGGSDASGEGEGAGQTGEPATTSEASETPLYTVTGEELPAGFKPSGLETPEGAVLYHYEGDTAGEPHKFDLASNSGIALYAETDDNSQPVKPAATDTATA
jgi:hypothetical protein